MNSSAPRKVIYDTDPGVDDAMALYYALAHPGIDIVGITTTFGNVTVDQAATNALYLSALAGRALREVAQSISAVDVGRWRFAGLDPGSRHTPRDRYRTSG